MMNVHRVSDDLFSNYTRCFQDAAHRHVTMNDAEVTCPACQLPKWARSALSPALIARRIGHFMFVGFKEAIAGLINEEIPHRLRRFSPDKTKGDIPWHHHQQ